MGDYRDLLREALGLQQAGRIEDAAARYRAVLAELPDEPNATYLLGVALHQLRRPGEAIPLLERAVEQRPDFADAHNNLGEALRAAKRAADAVARYERALALSPGHPAFLANLSHGKLAARDVAGALAAARAAIGAEPGLAAAHQALGNALQESGDVDGARAAFEAALARDGRFFDAHANLALLEGKYGDPARAVALFESLPRADGRYAEPYARALARVGRADAAQAVRRETLGLAATPADFARDSALLFHANYEIWEPAPLWELHRQWGAAFEAALGAPATRKAARRPGPLRVGFVSNDFKRHSCAHFLLPLLGAFEPARVAIVGYSDVEKPDDMTARLAAAMAEFHPVRALDDGALARRVRDDGIDILVDLGGHTAGNRLGAFARRACAVQASWLGYANTTGLAAMDWRLTDAIADPPGQDAFHGERLWRLPEGFLRFAPFDPAPAAVRRPRAGGFRFGCFNALEKITAPCWETWCAILRALPGATLRLKAFGLKDPAMAAAWGARVRAAGLEDRVALVSFVESEADHLAQYGEIDLALDTAPYGGTTTTCEALWMGVPVLTLAGARHAARVGASLLARVPDSGVVVESWDAYRDAAIGLANDPARYADLAGDLALRVRSSTLADGASLAAAMTDAFEKMAAGA